MVKNRRERLREHLADERGEKHSTNPYTAHWQPELVKKRKRFDLEKKPAFDDAGNRLAGHLLVPYEKDGLRFLKVAHAALLEQMPLSNTAKKVLLFVQHQALAGNATVWAPATEGAAACGFKQNKSFHEGIAELILYEFLARTEKVGFYYINPTKFFNGDRRNIKNTFSKPSQS